MRRCARAARRPGLEVSFAGPFDDAGVPELIHVDVHEGGRGHTHLDLRYLIDGGDADPTRPRARASRSAGSTGTPPSSADPGLRGLLLAMLALTP
jgi:hypothetical protein